MSSGYGDGKALQRRKQRHDRMQRARLLHRQRFRAQVLHLHRLQSVTVVRR
jgi:hypothetical protein